MLPVFLAAYFRGRNVQVLLSSLKNSSVLALGFHQGRRSLLYIGVFSSIKNSYRQDELLGQGSSRMLNFSTAIVRPIYSRERFAKQTWSKSSPHVVDSPQTIEITLAEENVTRSGLPQPRINNHNHDTGLFRKFL